MKKEITTRELVITALAIALVYVFTWMVKIQLPIGAQGGLIHLGNIPFFVAAIVYGKRVGALSGAIGMGLFDVTSGWAAWAPITLVTSFIMGHVIADIAHDKPTIGRITAACVAALIIKIVGYYIGEAIMYGSLLVPIASIPGNAVQIVVSSVIVLLIIKPLRQALLSTRR
ncbi:ECF transporter S component [Peptoniphilus equinus]|uniref:ECF transporter S component n=1 Tax=Peptoniphilus equinus TaxID=3016343 RepID=A0ABY7QTV9_9FIRM|nr:ECF transporter S component [Peptoniphilus equinus]WBW50207.1 ECF transporter S component [Peptoniphilus equinus]